MNELDQWIEKAEGDYNTALRMLEYKDYAGYDAVCFHAQQCAEKYLKAFLVRKDVRFEHRHDHTYLLSLILTVDPSFEAIRYELDVLNDYAVTVRYPGDFADAEESRTAFRCNEVVRRFIRQKLGLETSSRT
jgi:HEPN domain-containing protein